MSDDEMITSAFRRFVKLGGLMGRVGASMVGSQLTGLARSDVSRQLHQTEALVRNATRIVETLGQMKGAAMKVGQMLSLHEGLLPAEVSAVLRSLQKEAPRVPAEVMEYEVRGQLPDFDDLFESLEPEAYAAASIGQVHLGRLRDGRRVAVKIQYPLIEEVIKADLKNLKTLLRSLFALFSDVDFAPFWIELRDRLLEELDYTHEARNMRRMTELHAGVPEIVIPAVVEEASTRGVLTMELIQGISPEEACSERYGQELRDRWGVTLFEFVMRGLFEHRFLHADPNLANFAFFEDGRVAVYDFGCVKEVPAKLSQGFARLTLAAIERRSEEVPEILLEMGLSLGDEPLPVEVIEPYLEIFGEIYRESPPYAFGEDETLYDRILELGMANWSAARDMRFPEDMVFINRTLSGMFGNLNRLEASGPWRELGRAHAAVTLNP